MKMDQVLRKLTLILILLGCGLFVDGLADAEKGDSLGKVSLVGPTMILEGDTLVMYCKFGVDENSSIYTVKWYKGSREIFRYQPKQYPSKKALPFSQLVIDENQSDMNKLVVKNVPLALRGNVSCEVTWEPSFTTITQTTQLSVVSPPQNKPKLVANFRQDVRASSLSTLSVYGISWKPGDKPLQVRFDDFLTFNCSSGPASPAPDLTFFINGEDVKLHRGVILQENEIIETENKTEIRLAAISLKLEVSQFKNRKLRVICIANIKTLYNETSEEFLAELPPLDRFIKASGFGSRNSAHSILTGTLVWATTTLMMGTMIQVVENFFGATILTLLV